ncbi:hypothetical protein [Tropicimonas sp. TH_r6]|nr:hypothetical protein [Tropicimonas sp. TH_r6]
MLERKEIDAWPTQSWIGANGMHLKPLLGPSEMVVYGELSLGKVFH